MAVLVSRLRRANIAEVTRCLDLIDALVEDSLATPGDGPIDCSKCLMKLLLFAANIAHSAFPDRAHGYFSEAKRLMPARPMGWTFAEVREEVRWYVEHTGAMVG